MIGNFSPTIFLTCLIKFAVSLPPAILSILAPALILPSISSLNEAIEAITGISIY